MKSFFSHSLKNYDPTNGSLRTQEIQLRTVDCLSPQGTVPSIFVDSQCSDITQNQATRPRVWEGLDLTTPAAEEGDGRRYKRRALHIEQAWEG